MAIKRKVIGLGLLLTAFVTVNSIAANPPFTGVIGKTPQESSAVWSVPTKAPAGAPNIVLILLDDIGFADTSVFGGIAQTPHLARLAEQGLIYNNFNVTAMCSPTRAALLTGRNHHRTGFGIISEGANGFPGYDSYWKQSTASVAEVLRQNGYRTAAFGKWHNTPEWEITPVGPFDRWPTGLGFEHFYGFMGAEDNHWEPNRLYRDTTPIDAPVAADDGYHLSADLSDRAIKWIDTHRSLAPHKPFFLYYATGAVHTPHHAPREWIERYRGQFDRGWDELRAEVFERQKAQSVIPLNAVLTKRPPQIPAWDSLSADQQRLYARQMEVYAGFVAYNDYQVGRLIEHIRSGLDGGANTLIMYVAGDNGAVGRPLSGYGGDVTLIEELARLDQLGGPSVPFNQYQGGWGWMGNTPFPFWKTVGSHFGGLRAPMIVSWPAKIKERGALRPQFQHVTDIVPTIYDLIGIEPPAFVDGVRQQRMDGKSLLPTFANADAPSSHSTQYFEMASNRAIYHEGWMASVLSAFMSGDGGDETWELYDMRTDFSQAQDLAAEYPQKLAALQAIFEREATANNVYPIPGAAWSPLEKPFQANGKTRFDFYQAPARVPPAELRSFNRTHALEAEVTIPEPGARGVLASFGFRNKGFVWYIEDGRLVYELREGLNRTVIRSRKALGSGPMVLRYEFDCDSCDRPGRSLKSVSGTGRLVVDGKIVGEAPIAEMFLVNSGEAFAFHLGRTGGSRISDAISGPSVFKGRIDRVTITID